MGMAADSEVVMPEPQEIVKCKNCGEEIERIFYYGHTWRHVKTCLFICFKDKKPRRGDKNYFEAEPEDKGGR